LIMDDVVKGFITYKIPKKVIKHAGYVRCKLFLEKEEEKIHVANFSFNIVDSGIESAVAKEIDVKLVDDAITRILKDNATDLLSKDFKEKIDKDVISYIEKNESRFKGAKGDKGEPGQPGAKGEAGKKGEQGAPGKNGTVVSINPDTKMWQIDGKDTDIKAEPELLDKINIANVEGLENKLQEVEKIKDTTLNDSKTYTDSKIAELVDSAPESMNTLRELAEAIQNNSISESVLQQIGSKVSTEDFEGFKQSLNSLYADKNHSHTIKQIEGLENALSKKSDINHSHDERYLLSSNAFTKEEADKLYQPIGSSQPSLNIWTGSETEYNYLYQKDPNTLYLIKG
ncbi:BppU family phage baseplate upper protein, partial [Staphylococcus aureus]